MVNIRLTGDHLYGKWLLTRLSLVMSLLVSYFVLFFIPRNVLDIGHEPDMVYLPPQGEFCRP